MLRRINNTLVCAALLAVCSGCVEMTQTITLNPDGRGKVEYDMRLAASLPQNTMPGGKEKTLDELKQDAVLNMVKEHPGFAAWKDIKADWIADGRLHIVGTAYFDRLEELSAQSKSGAGINSPFAEQFQLTRQKDETLTIKIHKISQDNPKKKPPPDFAKMTDKELDEQVLKNRVKYQSSKGILIAMFTDLKLKTVFHLPGDAGELKGFKKDTNRKVTRAIDGNKVLAQIQKFMAMDNTALKKLYKDVKSPELLEHLFDMEGFQQASLTVQKPAGPQFDYDKEVKDARAAYPALRQQLKISDAKFHFPGEK